MITSHRVLTSNLHLLMMHDSSKITGNHPRTHILSDSLIPASSAKCSRNICMRDAATSDVRNIQGVVHGTQKRGKHQLQLGPKRHKVQILHLKKWPLPRKIIQVSGNLREVGSYQGVLIDMFPTMSNQANGLHACIRKCCITRKLREAFHSILE